MPAIKKYNSIHTLLILLLLRQIQSNHLDNDTGNDRNSFNSQNYYAKNKGNSNSLLSRIIRERYSNTRPDSSLLPGPGLLPSNRGQVKNSDHFRGPGVYLKTALKAPLVDHQNYDRTHVDASASLPSTTTISIDGTIAPITVDPNMSLTSIDYIEKLPSSAENANFNSNFIKDEEKIYVDSKFESLADQTRNSLKAAKNQIKNKNTNMKNNQRFSDSTKSLIQNTGLDAAFSPDQLAAIVDFSQQLFQKEMEDFKTEYEAAQIDSKNLLQTNLLSMEQQILTYENSLKIMNQENIKYKQKVEEDQQDIAKLRETLTQMSTATAHAWKESDARIQNLECIRGVIFKRLFLLSL